MLRGTSGGDGGGKKQSADEALAYEEPEDETGSDIEEQISEIEKKLKDADAS
jgi:hypothetical protein